MFFFPSHPTPLPLATRPGPCAAPPARPLACMNDVMPSWCPPCSQWFAREMPEWDMEKYRFYCDLPGDAWESGALQVGAWCARACVCVCVCVGGMGLWPGVAATCTHTKLWTCALAVAAPPLHPSPRPPTLSPIPLPLQRFTPPPPPLPALSLPPPPSPRPCPRSNTCWPRSALCPRWCGTRPPASSYAPTRP